MLKPFSLLGYLAMVGGLVALIATGRVLSPSPVVIALQALATALMIWARITFGRRSFHVAANPTEGGLVTTGPYRHIRHPIYTGMCLFTAVGAAGHWSWITAGLTTLMFGAGVARMLCEEKLLIQRYPDYSAYAAKTWRMVPYLF